MLRQSFRSSVVSVHFSLPRGTKGASQHKRSKRSQTDKIYEKRP
jgi:hypothetical protein